MSFVNKKIKYLFLTAILLSVYSAVQADEELGHYSTQKEELTTVLKGVIDMPSESTRVSIDDVRSLINAKNITSIDDLVESLPLELRKNPILMQDSKSLQAGTEKFPRVILFNNDASTMVTFNDHSQLGGDALELIQNRGGKYEFYEIRQKANGLEVSQKNPPVCAHCHSDSYKPIWNQYPSWPGAFDKSMNDINVDANTGAIYTKHVANSPGQAFIDRWKSSRVRRYQAIEGTPSQEMNLRFTELLEAENDRIIVNRLMQWNHYSQYKYAIMSALICPESQAVLSQALPTDLKKLHDARGSDHPGFVAIGGDNPEREKRLAYLFDPYGFKMEDLDVIAPVNPSFWGGRFTTMLATTLNELDPDLREKRCEDFIAKSKSAFSNVDLSQLQKDMVKPSGISSTEDASTLGAVKTAQAIATSLPYGNYGYASANCPNNSEQSMPSPKIPNALKYCISCHERQENPIAPYIPFSDSTALSKQFVKLLDSYRYPHGTLQSEILYRLQTSGDAKMPKGINISDDERSDLIEYFKNLK